MLKALALLAGAFLLTSLYLVDADNQYVKHHDASVVIVSLPQGHGSGVYLGNGLILTAAHVAKEVDVGGKMDIENIKQAKGTATVLWFDANADVALMKLDAPMKDAAPARLLCSTSDAAIGDDVEVIGAPLNLKYIHTYGRVASEVTARIATGEGPQVNFLADVTAAPGNSGGPAFDKDGNLIGIVVAIVTAPLQGGMMMPIPSIVRLTYIIPKSVICKELSAHK
jgi:S1-C subfamily serine protease